MGGWTIAASLQAAGYDPVRDTISSLAARGATDRWVMTTALFALGACYLVTGIGFRPSRPGGRVLLVGGGVATMLVAAFPQPARGNSVAHTVFATAAFTMLAVWPAGAVRQAPYSPLMSRTAAVSAIVVMFSLLLWFTMELHGSQRGLAERAAAVSESVWPLAVLISSLSRPRLRRRSKPAATCAAGAA